MAQNLTFHSLPLESNNMQWDTSAVSSLVWPVPSGVAGEPIVAEDQFELVVVQDHKKVDLEAARGRNREVKEPDQHVKTTNDVLGGTGKMKSIGTDFGTTFLKTQVNKKRNLNEGCSITVHDYGRDHYHINGSPFQKDSLDDQALPKYTDRTKLAEAIPVLTKRRPEWANVRYVSFVSSQSAPSLSAAHPALFVPFPTS